MDGKRPTSYRLSEEARALLARLAESLAISQTAVLELAVRRMAREELPPAEVAPEAPKPRGRPREAK